MVVEELVTSGGVVEEGAGGDGGDGWPEGWGCWQCCHGIGVLAVQHEIRVLAMVVVDVMVVELAQGGGAGTRWW